MAFCQPVLLVLELVNVPSLLRDGLLKDGMGGGKFNMGGVDDGNRKTALLLQYRLDILRIRIQMKS